MKLIAYAADRMSSIVGGLKSALTRDPARAAEFLKQLDLESRKLRRMTAGYGRNMPYPTDVAPDLFFTLPNTAAIAAGANSAPLPLQFPEAGFALFFTVAELAGGEADLRVQIKREGKDDLISNGQSGDFARVRTLMLGQAGLNWIPLGRSVEIQEKWIFTFNNAGAIARTPDVIVGFKSFRERTEEIR